MSTVTNVGFAVHRALISHHLRLSRLISLRRLPDSSVCVRNPRTCSVETESPTKFRDSVLTLSHIRGGQLRGVEHPTFSCGP